MSGLFLRLAAQATGQRGTTLHSPARLPYQSLPERLQPTPEFATAPPSLVDRQPPQEPTSPSQRVAPAAPPSRHAPPGLFQEQAEKATQEEWIAPLPPLTNRPGVTLRAESTRLSGSASEKHAEIRGPAAPAAMLPPDDLSTPVLLAQVPVELPLQPAAQPPVPPANGSEVGALLRVPERTLDKLVLPPPLLPATPRGAASAPAAAASASALALPAREPDEVHIHIGRIEVTAIQESRPASKPSRKGAAPLSLDDYLARRKGDGS